jgi:hypothetical protein
VPELPGITHTDMMGIFDHIGKNKDFGTTRLQALCRDVDFELAETPAERDVLRFREVLVSKDHHATVVEDILDGSEYVISQRLGKIETCDLGAKRGRTVADIHRGWRSTVPRDDSRCAPA